MKKKISLALFIAFITALLPFSLLACRKDTKPTTTYKIWLDIQEDGIEAAQTVEFFNDTPYTFEELKFNVYSNAFDSRKPLACESQEQNEAYPEGPSFGKFELKQLHGDVKDYDFDFDKNLITVSLDRPVAPGQSATVKTVYSFTLPHTKLRYGFNERGATLSGFYPQLCALVDGDWYYDDFSTIGDPYFADVADYEVTFNLPDGFEYVSSGIGKTSQEDGETIVCAKAKNIRDFAIVLSDELPKKSEKYNGIELNYLGENPDTLEYAKKALNLYSSIFGKYAYDSLSVADMPFVAGGMEYGSICVINESLSGETYEEVVAHEIAHQWWYSAVGSNNLISAWQDEGLTNYSTYLYFIDNNNPVYADDMVASAHSQYRRFCDIQNSVGEPAVGKLGGRLNDFPGNYYYTNLTYNKSLMMWKYAQDALGRETLINALARYAEKYRFKIASEDDLWNSLDGTSQDASALIKNWIKAV